MKNLSPIDENKDIVNKEYVDTNIISLLEVLGLDTDNYNANTTYTANQIVIYSHKLYKAIQTTTGNLPTDTTYWEETSILV